METWMIVLLILIVLVALIAAAIIWYIKVSGIYTVIRETQRRRAVRRKRAREALPAEQPVLK
jgi:predicted membrane protein